MDFSYYQDQSKLIELSFRDVFITWGRFDLYLQLNAGKGKAKAPIIKTRYRLLDGTYNPADGWVACEREIKWGRSVLMITTHAPEMAHKVDAPAEYRYLTAKGKRENPYGYNT